MAVTLAAPCTVCGAGPCVVVLDSKPWRHRYVAVSLCANCARKASEAVK